MFTVIQLNMYTYTYICLFIYGTFISYVIYTYMEDLGCTAKHRRLLKGEPVTFASPEREGLQPSTFGYKLQQ